jgi:Raf kinase inhibitor-like YbhB/YbcL family protein
MEPPPIGTVARVGRLLAALALAAVAVSSAGAAAKPLRLTSPAFANNATSPDRYTCRGENVSPALRWTAPPKRTRSFALELHDPDAPLPGGFTHWLGWGIRSTARGLRVGQAAPVEGANGSGEPAYTGPCPPSGVHRYRFTLFALDAPLRLKSGADRAAFRAALKGLVTLLTRRRP